MADAFYQTGGWINWSKGPILGPTVTLSARDGKFLIAFLALFVRSAGSSVWNILRFIIHQRRSRNQLQDGLYHQQQATLRNNTSHTGTLWQLMKLSWFWRSNAEHSLWRSIPIMMLAILQIALFTVAGIFSSRVATTNDVVLIQSPACGYFSFPNTPLGDYNESSYDGANAYEINQRQSFMGSSNYARSCYNKTSTTAECDGYVQAAITSLNTTLPCPFAEGICLQPDGGTVQLDSGLIDSDLDLGINARKADRVQYRRVTTCAPLNAADYVGHGGTGGSTWEPATKYDYAIPGDKFLHFFYGPRLNENGTISDNDVTYSYSNYTYELATQAYVLGWVFHPWLSHGSANVPHQL